MRSIRFLLLLFCFIALPIFLTCLSLVGRHEASASALRYQQRSRLRALFSFSTPSSLFPPSAVISLTNDNSTFFLARPAAFGPSLPSRGLSGRLWVGKGFGDDKALLGEDSKITGFELGCSDVPGWGEDYQTGVGTPLKDENPFPKFAIERESGIQLSQVDGLIERSDALLGEETSSSLEDGTDDHLHRPLPDSNPALAGKIGEPANLEPQDKSRKPTHADIESLQESADIAGKIVMLSRGGCGFLEKVKWAQRRGGVALIVGDNERNVQLTIMYAKGDTSNVTIPAIFTSYTSAHLLSSLVPPEKSDLRLTDGGEVVVEGLKDGSGENIRKSKPTSSVAGPVFTSPAAIKGKQTDVAQAAPSINTRPPNDWMQNVLQAVGLDEKSMYADSRRPPGSGNIEWVQVEDWDEDDVKTSVAGSQSLTPTKITSTSTRPTKVASTSVPPFGTDDFVIGVQDWRDTDLIAPKPSTAPASSKGKGSTPKSQQSTTASGRKAYETTLTGGSIIPGSGEYLEPDQPQQKKSKDPNSKARDDQSPDSKARSIKGKLSSMFSERAEDGSFPAVLSDSRSTKQEKPSIDTASRGRSADDNPTELWVTLTPTTVSASPFFDTLLVLVVSPLVTLTVVYGLLLLRSRIRRRRWRAPKSIVERLPVRTYHVSASSSSSSTTSSQLPSPDRSDAGSPQLRPNTGARQRSQTSVGASNPTNSSPRGAPQEKTRPRPKRYQGRQVECVVCLEEYVDGESKVMSLPCGHEFHAECITPWLVNRRRTCPICKGDVVRSVQRAANEQSTDDDSPDESSPSRANDVLEDDASAAIPIPERSDDLSLMDEDIERGVNDNDEQTPADAGGENQPSIASRWRGIITASVSSLSGDTVWRSSSADRNR